MNNLSENTAPNEKNKARLFDDVEPPSVRRIRLLKQISIIIGATMCHLNAGMAMSWPNTLASDIQVDNTTFFGIELQLLDWEMDMTSSMTFIGMLPGFVFGGWLVARIGRRRSMSAPVVPGTIGWLLVALALNSDMVITGRFIGGIAYGLLSVAVRTYVVEISDTSIRGAAGLASDIMKASGSIVITGLGIFLPWYYLAFVSVGYILIYGLFIVPLLPESPTYLLVKGKEEEARQILWKLRGQYADIEKEIENLKEKNACAEGGGLRNLLKMDVFKKCLIVFGLFLVSNFCGTEVIRANALRMLQTSGLSLDKDLSTILVYLLFVSGNISQAFLIDRLGRRKCLILSLVLLMFAYLATGTYVFFDSVKIDVIHILPVGNTTTLSEKIRPSHGDTWSWIPTVTLMLAAYSSNLGIGPIPWMISAEYFPTNIRSQVISVCFFFGCLLSFITLQIYSPVQVLLTPAGLDWSYSFCAAIGIVYTLLVVTETKGRTVG